MDVEIHPNAKKHLTEKQVLSAWLAVTECIRRESKDEPPRWLAIGWLSDGRSAELVAVELVQLKGQLALPVTENERLGHGSSDRSLAKAASLLDASCHTTRCQGPLI